MTGAASQDDLPNLACGLRALASLFDQHAATGLELDAAGVAAVVRNLGLHAEMADLLASELEQWRRLGEALPQPGALQ